ncbi:ABC transporter ATP-binding protein [Mongoliimonas terrestris]|uniref:ABC transporter ATP-binding protein n=1 Tax=Mongoliimonas terrestris TaxID=1709001 RepID=UPI0009496997|nr:ABC transporter ATP-binding protein [Mongoliimonas terrestris]
MTDVVLEGLTKTYAGASAAAVAAVDLVLASGTLTTLVGPSGCGKSTVLKLIAGLLPPSAGRVLIGGRSMADVPPERRGAVLMGQDHGLFPHMTVEANVGFGLRMRGVDPAAIRRRAGEMLDLVRLSGFETRRPSALSGGQAQRVALARALVVDPAVLLLDEPLSDLDPELRLEMRDLIRSAQRATGITTLFVTHDREEAVAVADRTAVMLAGRIAQQGRPDAVFERPATRAVAAFFGIGNILDARFDGRTAVTALGCLALAADPPPGADAVVIRPERIGVAAEGAAASGGNRCAATVVDLGYRGTHVVATFRADPVTLTAAISSPIAAGLQPGDRVRLHLPAEALHPVTD